MILGFDISSAFLSCVFFYLFIFILFYNLFFSCRKEKYVLVPIVMDKKLASNAWNNTVNAWNNTVNSAKSFLGLDRSPEERLAEIRESMRPSSSPFGDAVDSWAKKGDEALTSLAKKIIPSGTSGSGSSSGSTAGSPSGYSSGHSAREVNEDYFEPQTIDYLNADLAEHYGLGAATAYQEALSNTAYQRAVKDMKAAGLNPAAIFGSGKGYTAGGVSYVDVPRAEESYTNAKGYSNSSSGNNGKLFSEAAYHAISTAGGLATMAIMKKGPIGFYIGQTATKAGLNLLDKIF